MSPAGYNELEKYVKRTLKITQRAKFKLVCLVPYGDNLVMCAASCSSLSCYCSQASGCCSLISAVREHRRSVIKDKNSMVAFHRAVVNLGYTKLLKAEQLTLAVCPVAKVCACLTRFNIASARAASLVSLNTTRF